MNYNFPPDELVVPIYISPGLLTRLFWMISVGVPTMSPILAGAPDGGGWNQMPSFGHVLCRFEWVTSTRALAHFKAFPPPQIWYEGSQRTKDTVEVKKKREVDKNFMRISMNLKKVCGIGTRIRSSTLSGAVLILTIIFVSIRYGI